MEEGGTIKAVVACYGEGRLCGDENEHLISNKMSPNLPTVEEVHRAAAAACLKRHRQSNKSSKSRMYLSHH